MTDQIINLTNLENILFPITSLCSEIGVNECYNKFKQVHLGKGETGDYDALAYNEALMEFTWQEQVDQGIYVPGTKSFSTYMEEVVNVNLNKVQTAYTKLLQSLGIVINPNAIIQITSGIEEQLSFAKSAASILSSEGVKGQLSVALEELERNNNSVLRKFSLTKKGTNASIKSMINRHNLNAFISDKLNPEVTVILHDGLLRKRYIEKCTLSFFQKFFYTSVSEKAHSDRINWIGGKGLCRYFIEQMEELFYRNSDENINAIKWQIAENVFLIDGVEYPFTKQGTTGKVPAEKTKQPLDAILKTAHEQYRPKEKPSGDNKILLAN